MEEIITTLDDDQRHLHISAPNDDWNEKMTTNGTWSKQELGKRHKTARRSHGVDFWQAEVLTSVLPFLFGRPAGTVCLSRKRWDRDRRQDDFRLFNDYPRSLSFWEMDLRYNTPACHYSGPHAHVVGVHVS